MRSAKNILLGELFEVGVRFLLLIVFIICQKTAIGNSAESQPETQLDSESLAETTLESNPESKPLGDLTLTKYYHRPISWAQDFRLGVSIEDRTSVFFESDPNSNERVWNNIYFRPYLDIRFNSHVRTYGELRMIGYLPQSDTRVQANPKEAYLDLYLGKFDIRAGYQIFAWGAADLYNPTDLINPWDYTDVIEAEKLGVLSFKLGYSFSNWSFEAIYVPLFQESIIPPEGSRFFVPFVPSEVDGIPVDENIISLAPDKNLKNFQAGARFRGTVGRFDMAFSYFYGFNNLVQPVVIAPPPDPQIGAIPADVFELFPRQHEVGLNLSTVVKNVSLHLESSFIFPTDSGPVPDSVDNFRFTYVVGGNHTFYNVIKEHDLRLFVDFAQEIQSPVSTSDFFRLFQLALFSKLEYILSDDLSFSVEGGLNFDHIDYIIRSKVSWNFYEGLQLVSGIDIIRGADGTFVDQFDKDDRFFSHLKYKF